MPKLTGLELARRIDDIDKDTKIIIMTAFVLTKDEIEKVFSSTRIDAFVRKPVGIVKLKDHLNALLDINNNNNKKKDHSSESFVSSIHAFMITIMTTTIIIMLKLLLSIQNDIFLCC